MRSSGAAVPGLVVVASFSIKLAGPTMVIQTTTGSSDVASGENRASTSVVADVDGVFGCRFLHEGTVYVALVIQFGLLRGKL
jgi:hypothetical protein